MFLLRQTPPERPVCGWPAADDFRKIFLIVVIVRFFRNKTEIVHGVLRNTGTVRRFLIAAVRISCVAGRRGRGAAAFLFLLSGWKRIETGSALPSGARFCTVFAFFFVVILPVVRLFPRFKLEEHACCGENGRDNPEHHVQIDTLKKYAMRIVVRAPQMEVTRITEMRSNGTQIRPITKATRATSP